VARSQSSSQPVRQPRCSQRNPYILANRKAKRLPSLIRRYSHEQAPFVSDGKGRLLWCGAIRPGRMHDVTALRTEGIEDLLRQHPTVKAKVDSGYQGLARDFPDQVTAPPKKPAKDADDTQRIAYDTARHTQSSQRICVEHAIAEPKQWRSLQRYIGRREHFEDTICAIAGLVSDRTADR
jgi:hypothetical protein